MQRRNQWPRALAGGFALAVLLAGCATRPAAPGPAIPAVGSLPAPPIGGGIPIAFAALPPGHFRMGNDGAGLAQCRPEHTVVLRRGFQMSRTEITNAQFCAMLNWGLEKGWVDRRAAATPGRGQCAKSVGPKPQKLQDYPDEHSQICYLGGKFVPAETKADFPAVEVTWYGAALYCNYLSALEGLEPLYNPTDWSCQVYGREGYRLPTEAEWEYAARYPDGRLYPWGNAAPRPDLANVNGFTGASQRVGSCSPAGDSALGLADLAGNVAEWCQDPYDLYSGSALEIDPEGPPAGAAAYLAPLKQNAAMYAVRGGCWSNDRARIPLGMPFVMDCTLHDDACQAGYRSFDFLILSRQVIGCRVVKVPGGTLPALHTADRLYKIVKYVAGKDEQWFTADDPIYHYFRNEFDADGRLWRQVCLTVGPDRAGFTRDDAVASYTDYGYDAQGRVVQERTRQGAGPDGQWFTADDVLQQQAELRYDAQGRKVLSRIAGPAGQIQRCIRYQYNAQGQLERDSEAVAPGPDGQWDSADDTIEKYHTLEYDAQGRLSRTREYHAEKNGAGPDGQWFTADDVVSSAKASTCDAQGRLSRELKYIGAGPDGQWFTADDLMQYYTVAYYMSVKTGAAR